MRAGAKVSFQGKNRMEQAWAELPTLVTTLSLSMRRYNRTEPGAGEGTCIRTLFLYKVVTFSLFTLVPIPRTVLTKQESLHWGFVPSSMPSGCHSEGVEYQWGKSNTEINRVPPSAIAVKEGQTHLRLSVTQEP